MPVVVVVDSLPVAKILGRVQAAGRSMQHEMKVFGNGTNPLQRPPQSAPPDSRAIQACSDPVRSKEASWLRGRIQVS